MSASFDQRRLDARAEIEFESLFAEAEERLRLYSGQETWTDRLESDPGITLLQALTWNVSDLSWRHTHPLRDLLTPPPAEQDIDEGIFGRAFGPHYALTHSPVTADDYRRALLDLHGLDFLGRNHLNRPDSFLLRDALLLPESAGQYFEYWYDPKNYLFQFWDAGSSSAKSELGQRQVLGGYRLLLVPERGVDPLQAEPRVREFLLNHRNLCERVREIIWLEPQDLQLTISLELEDNCRDPARVLAQLFTLCEHFLMPAAQRYRAEELLEQGYPSEAIYHGPYLQHGWTPELSVTPDYQAGYILQLTPLIDQLLAIDGVKAINTFNADEIENNWAYPVSPLCHPRLWGDEPLETLAAGDVVRLYKRGQQLMATQDEIKEYLPAPELIPKESETVSEAFGRWRNLGQYHTASGLVPPCYNLQLPLQEPAPEAHQKHLHQFLLTFEQWLSNGCTQLADLPRLLAFRREIAPTESPLLWGAQWPFITEPLVDQQSLISDPVHAGYYPQLLEEIVRQGKDEEQELAILDWLLSYFGRERAPRILENNTEYLPVQRGWLSEQSQLGYGGSALRIGDISSPIKRIAARLGWGQALFTANPDLAKLPFYLIEHWALLPEQPDERYQELSPVEELDDDQQAVVPKEIWITLGKSNEDTEPIELKRGQQIDLILNGNIAAALTNMVIGDTEPNRAMLLSDDNPRLGINWISLCNAARTGKLQWRCSNTWLMEKAYPYAPPEDPKEGGETHWIVIDPLPPTLRIGDQLLLKIRDISSGQQQVRSAPEMTVDIVELDPLDGRLRVSTKDDFPQADDQYVWYPEIPQVDRFSFTVSLVFNRDAFFSSNQGDTEATLRWIRRVVEEEMPYHLRVQIHWFSAELFGQMGEQWKAWQNSGEPHGERAYWLLNELSLGELPPRREGIGHMHIATSDDLVAFADTDNFWNANTYEDMKAAEVMYIPQAESAQGLGIKHIATPENLEEFADADANWEEEKRQELDEAKTLFIPRPKI